MKQRKNSVKKEAKFDRDYDAKFYHLDSISLTM